MLFTIRRRSQVSLFLARVGRTCTLDRRVNEQKNVHLHFSGVQGDHRPALWRSRRYRKLSRPSERVHHMHTIVTRREIQTQSCGSNLRMRLERDHTETRGLRGLGKGDVRWVVEVVLGEHLPKPTR